ncbi:2'-5'-RNA ligase [Pelotomaculum schinkii]|uniref:RNA 2',3'-cyclic phosphodiesterase n=2 Tax=Pelotomaculum schinkii TaxID=78350 RepID=A0A4Y7REJ9_9FIRM|nr:2'-5'-RNA ligase [Pelotomaculum schinkii]
MRQMRLFIAVNFPEEIKRTLGAFIRSLSQIPSDLKWVREENLHLTVQFLGNVPEEQVPAVSMALQKSVTGIAPFRLVLKGAGAFPSVERPRVLWVGIGGETAPLLILQRQVQREMGFMGFEPEKRKFSPHLTLARARSPYGFIDVMEKAREDTGKAFGTVRIDSIELMLSDLQAKGPSYFVLSRAPLS